jgi:hypothetical protein
VNGGKVCGGVDAARVQHARICPGMIASGLLTGNDGSRSQTGNGDDSDVEIGSGKQVKLPDRAQKDKPKCPSNGPYYGPKRLIRCGFAPYFGIHGIDNPPV